MDIGQGIAFAARVVERFECLGIARQRPVRCLGDALLHFFERAIEPDCQAMIEQQFAIARLGECAPAQGHYRRMSAFDPAHVLRDRRGFDPPEFRLAATVENGRDGGLFGALDLLVDIEETPPQFAGEMPGNSRLARGHKAYHVETGRAFEPDVHAVPFIFAMRASTSPGNNRAAATSSQPDLGARTVRASRSTPRRIARAHCAGPMAMRRARTTLSGGPPARGGCVV